MKKVKRLGPITSKAFEKELHEYYCGLYLQSPMHEPQRFL